jgi:hypothetical protein
MWRDTYGPDSKGIPFEDLALLERLRLAQEVLARLIEPAEEDLECATSHEDRRVALRSVFGRRRTITQNRRSCVNCTLRTCAGVGKQKSPEASEPPANLH